MPKESQRTAKSRGKSRTPKPLPSEVNGQHIIKDLGVRKVGIHNRRFCIATCATCGRERSMRWDHVRNAHSGHCLACCPKRGGSTGGETHGLSKTPIYKIWAGMVGRCRDPKQTQYHGRGIKEAARAYDRYVRANNLEHTCNFQSCET